MPTVTELCTVDDFQKLNIMDLYHMTLMCDKRTEVQSV
jgi:hypothetical protein